MRHYLLLDGVLKLNKIIHLYFEWLNIDVYAKHVKYVFCLELVGIKIKQHASIITH